MPTTDYELALQLASKNPALSKALQQLLVLASKLIKAMENPARRSLFGIGKSQLEAAREEYFRKLLEAGTYTPSGRYHGKMCVAVVDDLVRQLSLMERTYPNWPNEYELVRYTLQELKAEYDEAETQK